MHWIYCSLALSHRYNASCSICSSDMFMNVNRKWCSCVTKINTDTKPIVNTGFNTTSTCKSYTMRHVTWWPLLELPPWYPFTLIKSLELIYLISPWTKWPPFRRHVQSHFLEWKYLNFKQNFIEIYSLDSIWQYVSIGSGDGLAPFRRQAIIWTNAHPVHWRIYAALGGDELKIGHSDGIDSHLLFKWVAATWFEDRVSW